MEQPGSEAEIEALFKAEFDRVHPPPQLSDDPETRVYWNVEVSPPFPTRWPPAADVPWVYYGYASGFTPSIVDGAEFAAPWGRVERSPAGVLRFTSISTELRSLGISGVRPLDEHEAEVSRLVENAGGTEGLLAVAGSDPGALLLLRRCYCQWQRLNPIASFVLEGHPAMARALQCDSLPRPPEPLPDIHLLLAPLFFRRFASTASMAGFELGTTAPLPQAWPVLPDTPIVYYGFPYRVLPGAAPKPREIWSPVGVVVRQGPGGPHKVGKFEPKPMRLGVESGKRVAESPFLPAEEIEDLFVRAPADPAKALALREYYNLWRLHDELLSAALLRRHAAFAEFLLAG